MRFNSKKTLVSAAVFAALLPLSYAMADDELSQRVERLERVLQGQGLIDLMTRVDRLNGEIKRLNGENESLRHEIEQMQQRQREMYIDLDERLQAATTGTAMDGVQAPETLSDIVDDSSASTATDAGTDDGATTNAAMNASTGEDEAAYQAALQALRSGQYDEAVTALAAFPEQYPESDYLPNAYYWQGEAKYVMREFADAAALFQIVIDQYPSSAKVPDALLKRGFSEDEMGDAERSAATLKQVIEQYPNSSAARLASARLGQAE